MVSCCLPLPSRAFILGCVSQWADIMQAAFVTRSHVQLMKRSVELLRFLVREGQLTPTMLDMLWDCSRVADKEQAEAVCRLLADLAKDMPAPMLAELFGRIAAVPASQYASHTMLLVACIVTSQDYVPAFVSHDDDTDTRTVHHVVTSAMELLWRLALYEPQGHVGDPSLQPELDVVQSAVDKLKTIVFQASGLEGLRAAYFRKAADNIVNQRAVFSSLILLRAMIEAYGQRELPSLDCSPSADAKLLEIVLAEIPKLKASFSLASVDTVIGPSGRTFAQHITARFDFIEFLLSRTALTVSLSQARFLWKECVVCSVSSSERDRCLQWFTASCVALSRDSSGLDGSKLSMDGPTAAAVFDSDISDPMFLKTMGVNGFACFRVYFLYVNTVNRKISKGGQRVDDFQVVDWSLQGLEQLWRIVLDTDSEDIAGIAVSFLTMLRQRTAVQLLAEMPAQRKGDCIRCMETIVSVTKSPTIVGSDVQRVVRSLRVIEALLDESEPDCRRLGVIPHSPSLGRKIVVSLTGFLGLPTPVRLTRGQLVVYSKERGYDLRATVVRLFGVPDSTVQVLVHGKDITGPALGKTLEDLGLNASVGVFVRLPPKPKSNETVQKDADPIGLPSPSPESAAEVSVVPASREDLPAIILSDSPSYVSALMRLLECEHADVAEKVWSLVQRLPSSPVMLQEFRVSGAVTPLWASMLQSRCPYTALYAVQMLEQLFVSEEDRGRHVALIQGTRLVGGTWEGRNAAVEMAPATPDVTPQTPSEFLVQFVAENGIRKLFDCAINRGVLDSGSSDVMKAAHVSVLHLLQRFILAALSDASLLSLTADVQPRIGLIPVLSNAVVAAALGNRSNEILALLDLPRLANFVFVHLQMLVESSTDAKQDGVRPLVIARSLQASEQPPVFFAVMLARLCGSLWVACCLASPKLWADFAKSPALGTTVVGVLTCPRATTGEQVRCAKAFPAPRLCESVFVVCCPDSIRLPNWNHVALW
jgi:hypothetical protein